MQNHYAQRPATVSSTQTQPARFQQLQSKARVSYKRVLRMIGKLDKQMFAFFFLNNTQAAELSQHINQVGSLKAKIKQFGAQFYNFNTNSGHGSSRQRPTIIVVADEIFNMPDKSLQQIVRHVIPNTTMTCRTANSNNATEDKRDNEFYRKKDQYQSHANVVQSYQFNNQQDSADVCVFDYLMRHGHDIISFKMCDRLAECWNSQRIEWHLEKGLKVSPDGSPFISGKPFSYKTLQVMSVSQRKVFGREVRQSCFCITAFKVGAVSAGHLSSTKSAQGNQTYVHECHSFAASTPAQINALKTTLGHSVPVTKYDTPRFNLRAPLGTSIFQMLKEREFADQNRTFLDQKYEENLVKLDAKRPESEKHPKYIEEPRPGPNHVVCAVCREQFRDYVDHIFSNRHKKGVRDQKHIYLEIDKQIVEIDKIQKKKQVNKYAYQPSKKQQRGSNRVSNKSEDKGKDFKNDDTSSGASSRSKITVATEQDLANSESVVNVNSSGQKKQVVTIDLIDGDSDEQFPQQKKVLPARRTGHTRQQQQQQQQLPASSMEMTSSQSAAASMASTSSLNLNKRELKQFRKTDQSMSSMMQNSQAQPLMGSLIGGAPTLTHVQPMQHPAQSVGNSAAFEFQKYSSYQQAQQLSAQMTLQMQQMYHQQMQNQQQQQQPNQLQQQYQNNNDPNNLGTGTSFSYGTVSTKRRTRRVQQQQQQQYSANHF